MKVRIYSPFLPYPVTEGAYRVIFDQVVSLLQLKHDVELVTWKDSESVFFEKFQKWEKHGSVPRVIRLSPFRSQSRIGRVWSSFYSGVASPELFYYPKIEPEKLRLLGKVDLAIYHYSFAHSWLRQPAMLPPEKKRVVHFHNLESELFELRVEGASLISQRIHVNNVRLLKSHESELLQHADELWFLSPLDLKKYQRLNRSSSSLKLIPPTYTDEILRWKPIRLSEDVMRVNLGFVGGMSFRPNQESALWILNQLVPELEKRKFQGKVLFLGRGARSFFQNRVEETSLVEVLDENTPFEEFLSQLSWMLVPHVSGSGVRIKLLDAFIQKIPVMATPEAVERLHPEIHKSPLIFSSESPSQWADQLVLESPFERRLKVQDLPFPECVRGDSIYRNV